jgi:hypothetical protein
MMLCPSVSLQHKVLPYQYVAMMYPWAKALVEYMKQLTEEEEVQVFKAKVSEIRLTFTDYKVGPARSPLPGLERTVVELLLVNGRLN